MADDEDHEHDDGPTPASAASVVVVSPNQALLAPPKLENLWKQQQQVLPLWFSKKEQDSVGGSEHDEGQSGDDGVDGVDGKLKRKEINLSADSLEDCSLELSLGLSLGVGGAVAKLKSKNVRQEELATASDGAGVEKKEEDHFSKDCECSPRRGSESGRSRTQAFWQELSVTMDGQSQGLKQEKVSPQTSDAVSDRLGQSQSADASSATGLSSVGSPTVGRLSLHAGLIENWGTAKYSMEDSKVAFAHDFWNGSQQSASQADEVNANEEKPLVKDLLRVANQGVAASSWGRKAQGGMAMQLLNGFRDVGDVDPVMRLSPAVKMSPGVSLAGRPKRSPGNESGDTRNDGLRSSDAGARQQSTGDVSSQDEPIRDGIEQGQVCDQDTTEEVMKQSRQVARKKRKALIEEQKLQKKVKKDVGGPGQSVKQPKPNAGITAGGLMASQSRPLLGSSREQSAGAHDVSSPPDSQSGEASVTGFHRKDSAMWQHGCAWEGPAASSPEPPPDPAAHSSQNENGTQVESEKGIEFRKGDASYQSHRRGLPINRHSGGDLAGHDSATAVSALSGNGVRQGQADSSWRQSMGDLEVNNQSATPKAADLLENDPVLLQRMSNRAGIQRRGDPNGNLGRSDVIGIPRRGLKYIENPRDTHSHAPKDSPSTNSHRPLPNELSLGSANRGGIFTHLQAASSLPASPPFGPLRPWPDSGDAVTSYNVNVEGLFDMSGFTGWNKGVCLQGSSFTETNDEVPAPQNQDGASIQRNRFQQGTTQSIPTTSGLVVHVGQEASSLQVGIAAGQMFGGTGSSPDLPWVTCTGAGPNGRTICGVLYRYQKGQVRIVCACHGRHMSPSEFVEHAGRVDLVHPEKSNVVGPFSVGSNAAPVQR